MKTAFLVDFTPRTRVVVDTPKGFSLNKHFNEMSKEEAEALNNIIGKAIQQMLKNPADYIAVDNISNIEEDTECPCGTFEED